MWISNIFLGYEGESRVLLFSNCVGFMYDLLSQSTGGVDVVGQVLMVHTTRIQHSIINIKTTIQETRSP